ncbi:MAG: hypothetical protein KKF41_05690 [Actinobacteria bacterium]|nr:hypothetical protein [Actinomycetota bacterium]MBU1943723.1 hypothetical protein [Actinomycetota bacterium]MBU2687058.1 hypothetical protein [Actinomycetota bacterium]
MNHGMRRGETGWPTRSRRRLLARSLAPLAPGLIGCSSEMCPSECRTLADDASSLVCMGPIEVTFTILGGIWLLNVFSFLTTGKRLRGLTPSRQAELYERAFRSRFMLLRGASVMVGLPLKVAYYNREDVCVDLGFDREALVSDARLHLVTRTVDARA